MRTFDKKSTWLKNKEANEEGDLIGAMKVLLVLVIIVINIALILNIYLIWNQ